MTLTSRIASALASRFASPELVGHGGMAYVFRAADSAGGGLVAVKVLDPRISRTLERERFLREIAVCSRLEHPHIVQVLGSGEVEGTLYYVMPFIEGGSLRSRLAAGPLPVQAALRLAARVADALAYAHGAGFMHRDLKPENLLGHTDVWLSDFGFARAVRAATDQRITRAGDVLGTPEYMSPEQAMGRFDIDQTCDLYALGCVLFEMLTGQPPFVRTDPGAAIVRGFNDAIPPIHEIRAGVPPLVERILAGLLEWNPRRRLQSAAEVRDAVLHSVAAGA
jgi:eukaryotic-like serine/threonine-protein kinase